MRVAESNGDPSPRAKSRFSPPFQLKDSSWRNLPSGSFALAETEALFNSCSVSRFRNIERVARRKLLQIHAATEIASVRIPPGNQLANAFGGNNSMDVLNRDSGTL